MSLKINSILFALIIWLIAPAPLLFELSSVDAAAKNNEEQFTSSEAPVIVSDDNVYVTWWTNKTGDNEVLFRASNDGGLTFDDKINLSNTTTSESVDAMIDADGNTVVVTWWERNQTANEPVLRISSDAGQTFGPLLQLSHNGTLGTSPEEQE